MSEYLLSPILQEAQSFALRLAVGGVGVCVFVLLMARILRRRSEPLRYAILFGGVVALLALPLLVGVGQSVPPSVWGEAQVEEDIIRVPVELLPALLDAPAEEPAPAETPALTLPIVGATLLGLWLVGVIVSLSRLSWAFWKQRRVLVGQTWRADFWTDDLKAQLAQKLGLRTFPNVHVSPTAPMPLVIGLWRPLIVLPEAAPATWSQAQWEAILLHEGAHIARRDPWAVLAQHVAVALFWWCPLAHLVSRRLHELREDICDDYALQGPCDHVHYAELLVETAERLVNLKSVPVPLALLDSARGGLEARVMRLLEKEKRPMIKLSLAGKLLGAGFLVAACLLTTAATAFSQGQPVPAKKVQIKILVDGKEIDLDPNLLESLFPAQKADDVKPASKPAPGGAVDPRGAAFAGEILATSDGKTVTIIDAKTGKIIAKYDQPRAGEADGPYFHKHIVQAKPDPRIEELVKQAEAIKPGSGAEIRKALQGGGLHHYAPARPMSTPPGKGFDPGIRLWDMKDGKKIIILSVEDGKVIQLTEQDLKKLMAIPSGIYINPDDIKKRPLQAKPAIVDPKLPLAIPTAPNELEALRRQLERMHAELQELRKRVDANKK